MTSEAADLARVQMLAATSTEGATPTGAAVDQRLRLTSALVGSSVLLPAGVPLWEHVHPSSRELQRISYDGAALVVHNTEPSGASFLVPDDAGQPRSRRGPAVTLHRPDDLLHDQLLVVFCSDLTEERALTP